MNVKTLLLISNPKSRNGGGEEITAAIRKLRANGVTVKHLKSSSAEESQQEILNGARGCEAIMVAGGDGTVSSVAGAVYKCQIPLAILPMGTANDLARSLAIPNDAEQACDAFLTGQLKSIDLGNINDTFFFNSVTIGLGTKITRELTAEIKKKWGVLSYLKAFFSALVKADAFRAKLTIDGKKNRRRLMHISVGNGRFYGGGNVINERCEIDDGFLYVYALRPQSVISLLTLAPLLRFGKQWNNDRVITKRAKTVNITTKPSGKQVHADGESIAVTPVKIKLIEKTIQVFAPKAVALKADASAEDHNLKEVS